jgi:hypothetical protein
VVGEVVITLCNVRATLLTMRLIDSISYPDHRAEDATFPKDHFDRRSKVGYTSMHIEIE